MSRVNQTVCTLVAACLLSATPAWAAESPTSATNKAEQVKQENSAKQKQEQQFPQAFQKNLDQLYQAVPELKALHLESTEYDEDGIWGFTPFWTVKLTSLQPENTGKADWKKEVSANVTLDAKTGRILSFSISNPAWASEKYPDKALAKEKATAFMRAFWGDNIKEFQASDSLGESQTISGESSGKKMIWSSSTVYFESLVNGLPVQNNSISVSVDAAGHLVGYNAEEYGDPNQVKWPDPKTAIPKEQAETAYFEAMTMSLSYEADKVTKYGEDWKPLESKPVLAYSAVAPSKLDALTGKPLKKVTEKNDQVKVVGEGKKLTVASREETEKWLKNELNIDVSGTGYHFEEKQDREDERSIKRYEWRAKSKDSAGKSSPFRYVYIETDMKTNQITNVNILLKENKDVKGDGISQAEAQKKALAVLQRYLDPKLDKLLLNQVDFSAQAEIPSWVDKSKVDNDWLEDDNDDFRFTFHGMRNGIPVDDERYRLSVDKQTGAITQLSFHPLKAGINLPAADKIISADKAKETYKKKASLKLAYFWEEYYGQRAPQPQLVYTLDKEGGYDYVDAPTGELIHVTYP